MGICIILPIHILKIPVMKKIYTFQITNPSRVSFLNQSKQRDLCIRVIDKPNMKGLIFFLFLLAHTTMVWAAPIKVMDLVVDTLDYEILEIDPEINEEEYVRKRKLFNDSLLNYLATQCVETVLKIQDNVVVNFIVNGRGKVDSVWLVSPKDFPFEETCKFIKNYDFKGPLVEYIGMPHKKPSYTVRIILIFDRQRSRLGIYFDYTIRYSKR